MPDPRDERFGGWAPQSTVDRNHTELKQTITEQSVVIADMRARVQELEFNSKGHRESLNTGAASFTKLGERLNGLETKVETKFNPKWSTLIGAMVLIGGWIWTLSRYPDQTQFEAAKRDIGAIQQQQVVQQRDFSTMQRDLAKIDEKLDRVLNKAP